MRATSSISAGSYSRDYAAARISTQTWSGERQTDRLLSVLEVNRSTKKEVDQTVLQTDGGVSGHSRPQLQCRDLWKIYGEVSEPILRSITSEGLTKAAAREKFGGIIVGVAGVNLSVMRGEILCIMGLSGSGKSTLLRHFNRLIEPSAGVVEIDGEDILRLTARELRQLRARKIGMVFQHMALWPHRTVRDNVAYGLQVRGVDYSTRSSAAEQALALVDLEGWGNRYPDELSGGMQQRVGLARALAADPDILLMDEPFSALDPIVRADLQRQYAQLAKRLNKTTVFVTHDFEEAVKLGHRVAVMRDGAVVQIGTPAEIIAKPKDDYVKGFISAFSRLRHLVAADLAESGESTSRPSEARWIEPNASLDSVLGSFVNDTTACATKVADGSLASISVNSVMTAIRKSLLQERSDDGL